ncbi:MAG: hypothetical protein SH868_13835 [Bythopirellula sp.]|nr:hypothetical protein [Bythopirellula sp.]
MHTLLSDESARPPVLPRQVGEVELRVIQAGTEIDRLDLPEGKCTIGSSPSCQIRITTGQLKPLQCLIVRNEAEMTVTRWAAGVLLNGAEFTMAPFRVGDCLTIGDLQLQLVASAQAAIETDLPTECPVALLDRVEAQVATEVSPATEAELAPTPVEVPVAAITTPPESPTASDADLARLHSANQNARLRFRRLIGTLRELRDEAHGLDHHVHVLSEQLQTAQHVHQQLTAELHQTQAVAAERESQFGEELDRAIAELSTSYERANAAEQNLQTAHSGFQQLHEQIETLSADCERLQQAQSTTAAENDRLEQALSEREAEFVLLQQEFLGIQQAFAVAHEELQGHVTALQNQLAEVTAERDRQAAEWQQKMHLAEEATRAELQLRTTALQNELSAVAAEREQQVAHLRDELQNQLRLQLEQAQEAARTELQQQSATFQSQIADAAALREQQVDELVSQLQQAQDAAREATLRLETPDPALSELTAELTGIRQERQDLANENHRLGEQLADSEKRTQLLEIDVRSITTEWQHAQNTATRLQEAHVVAEAHIADLTAKMADLECAAAVEWSSECDHVSAQLAEVREQLAAREQALAEITTDRDQNAAQLATLQQELAQRQQELADAYCQLTDLQAELTRTEKERIQLAAELTARDAQSAEINSQLQRVEGQSARELEQRDTRITELVKELQHAREQLAAELSTRESQFAQLMSELAAAQEQAQLGVGEQDARLAELTSELEETQQQAIAEIDAQQARINELVTQLGEVQQQFAAELQTRESHLAEYRDSHQQALAAVAERDALLAELARELEQLHVPATAADSESDSRVAELNTELQQVQEQAALDLGSREAQINELAEELQQTREMMSAELRSRESQISELAKELKQTQDHLSDCAAQGERLHELYQQAQADLATLNSNVLAEASSVGEDSLASDLPPSSPSMPSDDPRDDDEPRIVRALASVADPILSETSEPAEQFEAPSFIDRYSHLLDDENGDSREQAESTPAPTALAPAADLGNLDPHDDSALETYMANMMRRVRGETSSETIAPPLAKSEEPENGVAFTNPVSRMTMLTQRVSAPPTADPTHAKETGLIDLQELKGTSQKPPLPTSLSAMRELANISARQAIAKHRKRRHFEGALSKLLVGIIAGVTAAYMLVTAENYTSPYFLAGCAVAVVSGFWGFKLLGILLEMIRDGINNEGNPAELMDLTDALPIDGSAE